MDSTTTCIEYMWSMNANVHVCRVCTYRTVVHVHMSCTVHHVTYLDECMLALVLKSFITFDIFCLSTFSLLFLYLVQYTYRYRYHCRYMSNVSRVQVQVRYQYQLVLSISIL